jgi:hypothetical protein
LGQNPDVAATQLDSITSGKEFDFQDIEEDYNIPDAHGPSNSPPELVPDSQPVCMNAAHNLLHFFTEIEFPTAAKDNEKV